MEILHIIDVPRVTFSLSLSLEFSLSHPRFFCGVTKSLFFPLYYLRFKYTILLPFLKYLFISHNIL